MRNVVVNLGVSRIGLGQVMLRSMPGPSEKTRYLFEKRVYVHSKTSSYETVVEVALIRKLQYA